jgi:hypothetical protein
MEVKLRFRWDGEEGRIVGMDAENLLGADWIVAADFLNDVVGLCNELYSEVLAQAHKRYPGSNKENEDE